MYSCFLREIWFLFDFLDAMLNAYNFILMQPTLSLLFLKHLFRFKIVTCGFWRQWNCEFINSTEKQSWLQYSLRKQCPYSELFQLVFSRIQSKCGKIRARITPNTDTFHAVITPTIDEKQPLEVFCEKRCSHKFRKFNMKTPTLESLFNKVAGLKVCNFIKKRLLHTLFPVKCAKL